MIVILRQSLKLKVLFDRKIEFSTAGLILYHYRCLLKKVSKEYVLTIAKYFLAMEREINLSNHFRPHPFLMKFSIFYNNKQFKEVT
jgi:hypothetical protein